jgi:hypothetical protein
MKDYSFHSPFFSSFKFKKKYIFDSKETWNVIAIDTLGRVGMCKCFLAFSSKNEINIVWELFITYMPMCIKQIWNSERVKLVIHDDVDNDARHDVRDVICGNKKMVVLVGLPISQVSH